MVSKSKCTAYTGFHSIAEQLTLKIWNAPGDNHDSEMKTRKAFACLLPILVTGLCLGIAGCNKQVDLELTIRRNGQTKLMPRR